MSRERVRSVQLSQLLTQAQLAFDRLRQALVTEEEKEKDVDAEPSSDADTTDAAPGTPPLVPGPRSKTPRPKETKTKHQPPAKARRIVLGDDDDDANDAAATVSTDSLFRAPAATEIYLDDLFPAPPKNCFDPLVRWTPASIAAVQRLYTPHTNTLNTHVLDARVRTDFTDTKHDYYVDGVLRKRDQNWFSPSGFMDGVLFEAFDEQRAAQQCSTGRNPEYAGRTVADIREDWRMRRVRGSAKHKAMDRWLQHEPDTPEWPGQLILPPPHGFYRLMAALAPRFDVYRTEFTMFWAEKRVYGQADLLLRDRRTGKLVLCDHKNYNEKDLLDESKCRGRMGKHPFTTTWLDSKWSHCIFQLNFYREILARVCGFDMSEEMYVLQFRPDEPDDYYVHRVPLRNMQAFFELLPWDPTDPRHALAESAPKAAVLERIQPPCGDDHEGCRGPTKRARVAKGALSADVVWTGYAYNQYGYALPDSPWRAPERWRGEPGPEVFDAYEQHLLHSPDLMRQVHTLYGKTLACWCRQETSRCNADVLVKYANLLGQGWLVLE